MGKKYGKKVRERKYETNMGKNVGVKRTEKNVTFGQNTPLGRETRLHMRTPFHSFGHFRWANGHVQWHILYYSTTTIVRKNCGENDVTKEKTRGKKGVTEEKNAGQMTSQKKNAGENDVISCDVTSSYVTDLTSGHVTSGSSTTTNNNWKPRIYYSYTNRINRITLYVYNNHIKRLHCMYILTNSEQ